MLPRQRLPLFVQVIFSFETAFLLFLFAGRYKANPVLQPLFPVDPLVIFGVVSFAIGIWIISTERLYVPGFIVFTSFCIFVAWMWISLIWTPGAVYAREKLLAVTFLDGLAIIAGALVIANSRERFFRFMVCLNVFAFILAVMVLMEVIRIGPGRIVLINGGDDYLGYGRVCGLASMTIFAYLATQERLASKVNLALLPLLSFYIWVLLFGGGKGPLLSALIPVMMILPLGVLLRGKRVLIKRGHLILLAGLAAVVAAILWVLLDPDLARTATTLNRFSRLFSDNQGVSDQRRETQFWEFLELGDQAPILGHGVGAWPILTYGVDIRHHPHSLPLEVVGEMGVVGLILFTLMCFACIRFITLARLRQDPFLLAALLMALNMWINAGTSGDLGENRPFFFTMGLLLIRPLAEHVASFSKVTVDAHEDDDAGDDHEIEDDRQGFSTIRRRLSARIDDDVSVGRGTLPAHTL
jgi:hypothetical protein